MRMDAELLLGLVAAPKHSYTLAATGIDIPSRVYSTRQEATEAMHHILDKKSLSRRKVYDDKHAKTYIADADIRFYINRIG